MVANLFLVSFLVVAAGIVFLLYGPTRRGRPIVSIPRASLAKIELPPAARPVTLAPSPPALVAEPAPPPAPPPLLPIPPPAPAVAAPAPAPAPPAPLHHGFVPVVNSKGPLPPLRSRAARGTDAPRRPSAETAPTTVTARPVGVASRPPAPPPRRRA